MSENSEIQIEDTKAQSFDTLGLNQQLLAAISDAGYTTPTPIQARAIPEVLKGNDVLGIAQTGTGKTASFVLPMLEILSQGRAKARMPRTIILEPTRELAAQVAENFEKYGKNHKLNMALLIGGVSFGDQDALLMKGVDVLIATPGRLLDQFDRGKILMNGVQLLVIDEADRMLDMGFIPDIEKIVKITPFTRQTLFFSATMAPEIEALANQFLSNPTRIEVARPNQTASTIEQFLVNAKTNDAKQKRTILRNIIKAEAEILKNGIIFCNRKRDVDIVAKSLNKHGFEAAPIHGDLQQSVRTATLDRFRNGDLKLLVASDVAARGLDVPDVSHVFNYDVPSHSEDYVHRIGRTGRAGRSGKTYMIACPYDEKHLAGVVDLIKKPINVLDADVGQNDDPVHQFAHKPKPDRNSTRKPKNASHDARRGAPDEAAQTSNNLNLGDTKKAIKSKDTKPFKNQNQKRDFNENNIIGFGNDTPAFMMIDPLVNLNAQNALKAAQEAEIIDDVIAEKAKPAPKKRVRKKKTIEASIETIDISNNEISQLDPEKDTATSEI
jgi:superfamily II DNA/RNA helicase